MHAVGEKDHEHLAFGIDPHRGTGEASVTVGGWSQVPARSVVSLSRIPAERTVTERPRGEEIDGRLADDLDAVVLAAIQHHLREHREVSGGTEETGMSRHTAQGVGVFVVNLTSQRIAARRSDLGGSDAIPQGVGGTIHRLVHPEGFEHASCQVFVERLAGDDLDQESQNIGTQIGVDVLSAWTAFEGGAQDQGARFERRLGDPPDISARWESGGMREKLTDGDLILVAAAECGDIVNDRVIEPDLLFVEKNHDRRSSTDDLAEGRHVVDRALGIDQGAVLAPGELAESLLEDRRALSADNDRGAGVASSLDSALNDALDRVETTAGHADLGR